MSKHTVLSMFRSHSAIGFLVNALHVRNLMEKKEPEYGKQVITTLAKELTHAYGKGFERVSLYNYYASSG